MKVLFKGAEKKLLGHEINVGDISPNFEATKIDLENFVLSDLKGKVVILTTFPSIDTSVCSLQAARFNQEAGKHKDISVVTISLDLPFALGRFCAAKGIDNAVVVSDYKNREFANKYGVLIEDYHLLARTVFVLDKDCKVVYKEVCHNTSDEPNYDKALEVALKLL